MELLFKNGKGKVYLSVVNWLSSPIEELQVSGVLAIVNFARAGKDIFFFSFFSADFVLRCPSIQVIP